MQQKVLISLSINELKGIISECIHENLNKSISIEPDDEVLNQKQASLFLGISEVTLIKWKKDGRVPCEQLPGSRIIRYYKSQLRKVLGQNGHLLKT